MTKRRRRGSKNSQAKGTGFGRRLENRTRDTEEATFLDHNGVEKGIFQVIDGCTLA